MTAMVQVPETVPSIELTPEVIAFLRTHVVAQVHEPTEAELLAAYYQRLADPNLARPEFDRIVYRIKQLRILMQGSW